MLQHESPNSVDNIANFANTHSEYPRMGPIAHRPKEDLSRHLPPKLAAAWTHNAHLTTRQEIPISCRPTRIVIQKHTFWRATAKSCSVQRWTFDIARNRKHKVCVVLLWQKCRLYGSFTNTLAFWEYYSNFQERRCFYWINRSFQVKEEATILHFDIEWFTKEEDTTAPERLCLIKTAVATLSSIPISFREEKLSRWHHKHGWKNSFHLYTDLLFEHNAQGCMRDFVWNQVWKKLRPNPKLKCPTTGKPILDLSIYSMNRTFRVPGSSKAALPINPKCDPILPLPSWKFFMDTRMADRRKSPGPNQRQFFWCAKTINDNKPAAKKKEKANKGNPLSG